MLFADIVFWYLSKYVAFVRLPRRREFVLTWVPMQLHGIYTDKGLAAFESHSHATRIVRWANKVRKLREGIIKSSIILAT